MNNMKEQIDYLVEEDEKNYMRGDGSLDLQSVREDIRESQEGMRDTVKSVVNKINGDIEGLNPEETALANKELNK